MMKFIHTQFTCAIVWGIWAALLTFIYPIPGTIALRNVLLCMGLIGFILHLFKRPSVSVDLTLLKRPLILLVSLSIWMLVLIFASGWYPSQSLSLWTGDWLVTWATACVVFTFALQLEARHHASIQHFITAVLLGLMLHIVWLLAYQLLKLHELGLDVFGRTPFAERDYQSGLCVTMLALALGELLARSVHHARFALLISNRVLYCCVIAGLIATLTLKTRNGTLLVLGLLFCFGAVWLRQHNYFSVKRAGVALLLLTFIAGFIYISFKSDDRWSRFLETAQLSMDIHHNYFWLDPNLSPTPPLLANGDRVEESAYDRIAWATAAMEGISSHPMGIGYGHKAFGWMVNRQYNLQTGHESSHSGILDFTLANGWPGLVLWIGFCLSLLTLAIKAWRQAQSAAALLLIAHLGSYLGRIILDGHFSGFRLKLFTFILAILLAKIVVDMSKSNTSNVVCKSTS